ncbi:restriction endonuclease subunit S [Bifidobacterium margollesii]|nr:restriction endonuclease subunit S [Bifidobacterium margollesii]
MKALLPKKECNAVFLASALRNREALLLAETGSSAHGTKKLDTTVLGNVPIPVASVEEQNEFVTQVEALKSTVITEYDRLNTLYNSLAQRYFA